MATLLLIISLALLPCRTASQTESHVKAAVIFRLTQFVDWPESAFANASSPLELCVLKHPEIAGALDGVAGSRVGARTLSVRREERLDRVQGCQLLFLGNVTGEAMRETLSRIRGQPVLTLAEHAGFTDMGGMITLRVVNNKVRFEINDRVAREAGLSISAKLLRLAKISRP